MSESPAPTDSASAASPAASSAEGPAAGPAANGDDYVVVARRYRPQTFDELIGQEHVAKALKQAITAGRVGHAYLFTGARGVGKTSAARIFAKALNCTSSDGPVAVPCNACDVCQSVSSGDDMDVLEIDGASNRGIDEIRQLRQNAAIRPSRARLKIYIIDEVHMLTKEAFNALLKTLEEPPEHVKFVFATTEANKIPITILSRCQRFDFAGIEVQSIEARLAQIAQAEGVAIDAEALQTIAVRAAGSMRDSQSLLEQLLAVADGKITGDAVNSLLGIAPAQRVLALAARLADRDAAAALAELDTALNGGADVGQLIDQLMGCFRDAMTLCVGCAPDRLLYALPAQTAEVQALAQQLGVQTILAMLQVLDQTASRLRTSIHSRTLAEMAIVRISSLEDLEDLSALIAAVREGAPLPAPGTSAPARSATPRQPQQTTTAAPTATPQTTPPAPTTSPAAPATDPPASSGLAEAVAERVAQAATSTDKVAPANTPPANSQPASAPPADTDNGSAEPSSTGPSLTEQLNAKLAAPNPAGNAPPPRKSRRQQLADMAQQPFVQKAMELFDVEPDKLRYTPPGGTQ